MLTKKQRGLLVFIEKHIHQHGHSPSFEEMKKALGLRSKSGIHRFILTLEERGYIRRLKYRARALEVVRPSTPALSSVSTKAPVAPTTTEPDTVTVPLLGKIAAGTPITAIEDNQAHLTVPADMVGHGVHYGLRVAGDSMINEGIFDGDIAVLRQCQQVENGQIAAVLVDTQDATLKRVRHNTNGTVELRGANPDYKTQTLAANRVCVQGQLVGLLRSYKVRRGF